jgi:hypothetical protein
MKVAYIFHGHARTWQQTYSSFFLNVFQQAPGDIFIHTWGDKINPAIGSHWNGWGDLNEEQLAISNTPVDLSSIFQIYKPKIMIAETDPGIDNYWHLVPESVKDDIGTKAKLGVKNMLNGSRKIFEAAINYGTYDYIFQSRMDILYTTPLDITEFTTVGVRKCQGLANDIWMFGSVDHFNIKTNYYKHINDYWLKNEGSQSIVHTSYEDHLRRYLTDNGVPMLDSNLQFQTIRLF